MTYVMLTSSIHILVLQLHSIFCSCLLSNAIFPRYTKLFPLSEHLSFPSAEGRFTLRSGLPPSLNQTSLLLNPSCIWRKGENGSSLLVWVKASPGLFFLSEQSTQTVLLWSELYKCKFYWASIRGLGRKGVVCKCPIRGWGTHPEQITMAPDESQPSAGRKCQGFVVNHGKQGENLGNWIVVAPAFDLLYMQEWEIAALCIWMAEFCLTCMFCAANWFRLWYMLTRFGINSIWGF